MIIGRGISNCGSTLKHCVRHEGSTLRWHSSPPSSPGSNTGKSTGGTSSAWFFSPWLQWYSRQLDSHPIVTKCVSSGLIAAGGDLICQILTRNHEDAGKNDENNNDRLYTSTVNDHSWDVARTSHFGVLGALWVGPVLHYWYGALPSYVSRVSLRVAVDQFAFAPVFVTTFLSWLWLWDGHPPRRIPSELADQVPSIVVANWLLWIPAQAMNFSLVPVKYHVLFSNFVGLIWNAYLSYRSHNSNTKINK